MIPNKDFSIWLIGPSAAGKTTISKLLYENLKKNSNLILVDGDKIRNLYENNLSMIRNQELKTLTDISI